MPDVLRRLAQHSLGQQSAYGKGRKRAVPFPFHCQYVGARHLERCFLRVSMLGNRLQKPAAHRTSVCGFCKLQPIGPTKFDLAYMGPTPKSKAIRVPWERQVHVRCVPGMNGSALRISQIVRDAARITITVPPKTCRFLNARAKTMSSATT